MFPSKDLLNKLLPLSPTSFDSVDQYKTAPTQESAFLDKLYHGFPERVHVVMESSYFTELVLKSIADACLSEIKKLWNVVSTIFDLPSKYFTDIGYDCAGVPKIQKMLGVTSATNPTYTTFPPVLFPDLIEDKSLKTIFRNWKLPVQILKAALCGVTSLHQGTSHGGGTHTNSQKWDVHQVTPGSIAWASIMFSGSSIGKKSNINYKKVLMMKWKSKRIKEIVTKLNTYIFGATQTATINADHEDLSEAISRAMAALDVDSDDASVDVPAHGAPDNVIAAA
ncbi:hypothetical protein F4604DRAFT_1920958 [Suillus subluteus]|nr:hypothetical protein F4604DRAFT_1920958 [Suillus subluteus]